MNTLTTFRSGVGITGEAPSLKITSSPSVLLRTIEIAAEELRVEIREALERARTEGETAEREHIRLELLETAERIQADYRSECGLSSTPSVSAPHSPHADALRDFARRLEPKS